MEQTKSEEKIEKLKRRLETGRDKFMRCCERCRTELAAFSTEQSVTLAGTVSTRLCDDCRRDWDVDPVVGKIMREINRYTARANAFVHGGDADKAEDSVLAIEAHRDEIRVYAVTWLEKKITREAPNEEG